MPLVTDAPQSSPALAWLPALLVAIALGYTPGMAQERGAAAATGQFRKTPTGVQLGTVVAGAPLTADSTAGDWRRVTIEGWIFTASTRADRREGFDVSVRVAPTENLRIKPNDKIIARLAQGTLLKRVRTRGGWTLVRRTGWVGSRTFPPSPQSPGTAAEEVPPGGPAGSVVEVISGTRLMRQPGGDTSGTLQPGARAGVLARSGDWVKVRVEGWVPADSVRDAQTGALAGVSAAEVRANPERYVGRTVDWHLQYVAIQTADELRPEIPLGRKYLLTRGPAPEAGFVYVMLDQAALDAFGELQPLQEMFLRVEIVAPRTRYLPNPVVQLVAVLEDHQP